MTHSTSEEASRSVIVVGSGVIGLSLAWELVGRGHRVTLIDRGPIGRATSWAAAGILPPNDLSTATDPLDQLRGYSDSLFADRTRRLREETGIDPEYRACGGWYLSRTAGEAAAMTGMMQYWRDQGIACESISLDELATREPALHPFASSARHAFQQAWFAPTEHQVRPPRLLAALHAACVAQGVTMMPNLEVREITEVDAGAICALADGRSFACDQIVLAGGSHTGLIDERLSLGNSLVPIRGQILLLRTAKPLLKSIVNVGHRYVLCRDDGHTLVGSCEEEVGFDDSTTDEAIEAIREFAYDLIPALRNAAEAGRWSGLRPLTFDGFPMIGGVPERPSIYIASGHFRSGIHCAFGTARLLADAMGKLGPAIDLHPFRVGKQQSHLVA